jgi:hypothetical protein
MLAVQGHDPCIIGLDIAVLIGCSPWCAARLWSFWSCCLALQALQVFAGPGVRYQEVLELARTPGGLDIKGCGRVGRASEVRFDIIPTISILEVWEAGVR